MFKTFYRLIDHITFDTLHYTLHSIVKNKKTNNTGNKSLRDSGNIDI